MVKDVKPIAQLEEGQVYTKPTIKEYKKLIRGRKAKVQINQMISLFKQIVFFTYSNFIGPIKAYIKGFCNKQGVVVLLYHRVNDFQRDNLTVGVEQFDQQLSYIKKHMNIVPLASVISGSIDRSSKKPIIVVTFDDGYLDNYLNAFPLCVRNRVPCSFFVSTSMIEEQKPFPHDEKLDIELQNMNWKQLGEMKAHGMYIGSHTKNHINCAETSPTELTTELVDSQNKLDIELGKESFPILAYPFGGKAHFNEDCLKIAKKVGYKGVVSAHGGDNSSIDPYDIRRSGIDWTFSYSAFKAKLYGW